MTDEDFHHFFIILTRGRDHRWINPDGTPSQWFVHKGVLYTREIEMVYK